MIELALIGLLIAVMIVVGVSALYWRLEGQSECPACQGIPGSFRGHPDDRMCDRHYKIAFNSWMLAGDGD